MWCVKCQMEWVVDARIEVGFVTCLECGEADAKKVKHCVVPMAKSNYIVVTDRTILKQLNKYAKA
jgi:hypothetical protein